MHEVSLSAIGADRPGIVAAITGVLADLGCSIEDSEMAVLRGHFAVMLVVSVPDGIHAADIEAALGDTASTFELMFAARALAGSTAPRSDAPGTSSWSISVHGADKPGIVHGVTSTLAASGGNIVALRTHVAGSPDEPLYAMVIEATLPPGADASQLTQALQDAAARLGVSVSVMPVDEDLL